MNLMRAFRGSGTSSGACRSVLTPPVELLWAAFERWPRFRGTRRVLTINEKLKLTSLDKIRLCFPVGTG